MSAVVEITKSLRLAIDARGAEVVVTEPMTHMIHGVRIPWTALDEAMKLRPENPGRMIGRAAVCRMADLSGPELDELIRAHRFPTPTREDGFAVWPLADVTNWIAARRKAEARS